MGIPIPMLDLMFFLTENQDNPRHVGALLIFQRPPRGGAWALSRIVEAYRQATPVPPFNRIPVLLRAGQPEWREVDDFDLRVTPARHLRHSNGTPGEVPVVGSVGFDPRRPILGRRAKR